jgi:hypothetical protein
MLGPCTSEGSGGFIAFSPTAVIVTFLSNASLATGMLNRALLLGSPEIPRQWIPACAGMTRVRLRDGRLH